MDVDDDDRAINCNPGSGTVSAEDQGKLSFKLDLIGFSISFVSLCMIAIAILSDKRVKESHPNKIIAYICLCDAY